MTRFGYGTNGFADHALDDALAVVAGLGYEAVALTLDSQHLDPFAPDLARRTAAVARRLDELGLAVVVETGARYLLDPWHKHRPTLLDDDPGPRRRLLLTAVRIARDLGAEAVSLWSGTAPRHVPPDEAWRRLVGGVGEVLQHAEVPVGVEPEPRMLLDTVAGWRRLHADLGAPAGLGITLDVGHCRCLEPVDAAACVRDVGASIVHVQIDDMRRGVHEHLEFGDGEVDVPPVLDALRAVGYAGVVSVELPRHSHAAPAAARHALAYLRAADVPAPGDVAGREHGPDGARRWLLDALAGLRRDPARLASLFASARRHVGAVAADDARARLLRALPLAGDDLAVEVDRLYRQGDAGEKRAVLLALPDLDVGGRCTDLLHDAIRTNDPRLLAAALGPAARHLDDAAWRQAVLKCVFAGVPLHGVDGLDDRADGGLASMLAGLHDERSAAGRALPQDALDLLRRLRGAA